VNGFSLTAMGYHGRWNSTDQVADRAIASGLINRFGAIDPTDGGKTYRYSGTGDWQRSSSNGNASTRVTAFGIGYGLNLFSDFTYYLNDPIHGDQMEQADHRFITGGKVSHRRLTRWGGHRVLVEREFRHRHTGSTTSISLGYWWAHLEFTRMNTTPTFLVTKIEGLRTSGAFCVFLTRSSLTKSQNGKGDVLRRIAGSRVWPGSDG
jgi:hypothetical protein